MTRQRRTAAQPSGLHALNAEDEDATLDTLLHQYFRLAIPPSNRRLKRPRSTVEEESVTPEVALKRIKAFLKTLTSSNHIQRVLDALTNQLHKATRQPRVLSLAVRLASEVFQRSAAFRALIATQAAAFFTLLLEAAGEQSVGSRRPQLNLMKPMQSDRVNLVLAMIEQWTETYGGRYPPIVAGHAWLTERGYVFPRTRDKNELAATDETNRRRHQASVQQLQREKMEREMTIHIPEIETTLTEMDSIFEILIPTLEAFEVNDTHKEEVTTCEKRTKQSETLTHVETTTEEDDDVEWEDVPDATDTNVSAGNDQAEEDETVEWEDVEENTAGNDDDAFAAEDMDINEIVQAYGLGSSSYQLTISIPTTLCEKSSENEVLFRSLADGVLQIRKRFLPLVSDWIQIADHDALAVEQPRDAALLQQLYDLRRRLEDVTLKWEDLVKENERKQFARIRPRVVTLPLAAFQKIY